MTKAVGAGMPPFSPGIIPEHTAVGAHQAPGQRRAFLPFGKRVSSRGRAARGVKPASEGTDCRADGTLLPHCCSKRKIKSCADGGQFDRELGRGRREGGRRAEKEGRADG